MADRDMSKVLGNIEHELVTHAKGATVAAGSATMTASGDRDRVVESFAHQPKAMRNMSDSMEQIQQDFRKAVLDLENRSRLLIDELKRMTN